MSDFSQFSKQRAFHCPNCKGRIVIPANLAPATGPCPHCQATITSPEPETPDTTPATSPESQTPAPDTPTQVKPSTSAKQEKPKSKKESKIKPETEPKAEPQAQPKKRFSPLILILIILVIVACAGGAAFFFLNQKSVSGSANMTVSTTPTKLPANQTNLTAEQKEAYQTLENYLAASNISEKLRFIYQPDKTKPMMEAFYQSTIINEADTRSDAFSVVELPESDRQKNFILLAYDQPSTASLSEFIEPKPSSNSTANQRTKIYAFFKKTDQGLKLDWEVFSQTKYRTLNAYIRIPKIGSSQVFRVLISKSDTTPNTYQITDPAHFNDTVSITVEPDSPLLSALSELDNIPPSQPAFRTATIELRWSDDPIHPKLGIKRFICWEFLGLGGKE